MTGARSDPQTLSGRAALVTGGGRGIGAATAAALARAGARVAVAARNEEQVVETAARLRDEGLEVVAFRCDVTLPMEVRDTALSVREAFGSVDVLVNGASASRANPVERVSLEEWNHLLSVNATGAFLFTQAVLPGMLSRHWGRVVNVSSTWGLAGGPDLAAFAAAQHAVIGLTRALAAEVAGTGVTINAVCPAHADTPLTRERVDHLVHNAGMERTDALEAVLLSAGQHRLLKAEEVAQAVLELCADAAGARNGETVRLDGR